MQLYIARNQQRHGPMPLEALNASVAQGEVPVDSTLAWYEGCPDWIPLSQVPGIILPVTPQPPPVPAATPPTDADVRNEPVPRAQLHAVIPYKNPLALVAYYLGIFSLIPVLGAVLSLPALVLGVLGLRRFRRYPEAKGSVHAWVGIVAGSLSALIHAVLLIRSLI
jgi:hypothetical protein